MNRYEYPIEEAINFPIQNSTTGDAMLMTGTDALSSYAASNSVYNLVAADSLQLVSQNAL